MATETQVQYTREAPEIEAYKIGLLEQAKNLVSAPPEGGLPQYETAGMTPEGLQALNAASSGLGNYMPYLNAGFNTMGSAANTFGAGLGFLGQGASAVTPEMIQANMNPYQDAIQGEINRAYDMQLNQAAGQSVGSGAFGGSRAAVVGSEVDRNRASALAKSQADNYLQAQKAAQNQLARSLQAGQGMGALGAGIGQLGSAQAGLGAMGSELGMKQIGQLSGLAEQDRLRQQQALEAQRQNISQDIFEPYKRLAFLSDIYQGAPSTTQAMTKSYTPDPGWLNQILGAGIGAASAYGMYNKAFG